MSFSNALTNDLYPATLGPVEMLDLMAEINGCQWWEEGDELEQAVMSCAEYRLALVPLSELPAPGEHGDVVDEMVRDFATEPRETAPPIVMVGKAIRDGNHRLDAARLRGDPDILAYVGVQ